MDCPNSEISRVVLKDVEQERIAGAQAGRASAGAKRLSKIGSQEQSVVEGGRIVAKGIGNDEARSTGNEQR